MSFIVHSSPRPPDRGLAAFSRDSVRASLGETAENEREDNVGEDNDETRLRVKEANRRSLETSFIDLVAAERMVTFVTDHLVMQVAVLGLSQAPAPSRMALHLLL